MNLAHVRKFIVALVAAIGVAVTLGLLPEDVKDYVAVAVVFLGGIGVYAVPNEPGSGI